MHGKISTRLKTTIELCQTPVVQSAKKVVEVKKRKSEPRSEEHYTKQNILKLQKGLLTCRITVILLV